MNCNDLPAEDKNTMIKQLRDLYGIYQLKQLIKEPTRCMIKIFREGGEGVVDGEGGSSEKCLKWGGGEWGSLRDLSKNILK